MARGGAANITGRATGHPLKSAFSQSHSPDSPWHPRLTINLSTSASADALAGENAGQEMGSSSNPDSSPHSAWHSLLASWESGWFGCGSTAESTEDQGPAVPSLATYGSLFKPLSPSGPYMSAAGSHQNLAALQWGAHSGYRDTYWRPRSGNLEPQPTAERRTAASAVPPSAAMQDTHSSSERITTLQTSPGGDSSVAQKAAHGSGGAHEGPGSSGSSRLLREQGSSVTTTELFSQYVLYPRQASGAASDDIQPEHATHGGTLFAAPQAPVLGTWANRQYHLPLPAPVQLSQSHSSTSPIAKSVAAPRSVRSVPSQENIPQEAGDTSQGPNPATQLPQQSQVGPQVSETGSEPQFHSQNGAAGGDQEFPQHAVDAAMEAAWRWRFTRRWHAEQQRAMDGQPCSPDKHDEALAYLQAGGGVGWHMQVAVARTHSTEASGLHSVGTAGPGSLLAGEMLLEDGSGHASGSLSRALTRGPSGLGNETATRQINSLNRRAMQLLEQQQELERAAEARWNSSMSLAGGELWVGHLLPTVDIDDWGTFKFLVIRVRGRNDKQCIIVRGKNYCTEAQIIEDVNRKMLQLASQKGCAPEVLEVMGGGVMEWRRERDRHLHLHAGFTCANTLGAGAGLAKPASPHELLSLAAVLTKQNLPMHFKVSIEGQ